MCGIVGYIGKKEALPILIEGLRREIYRGYDSTGVVVFDGVKATCVKAVGKIENLERKLEGKNIKGNLGLAHCLPPDALIQMADGRVLEISKIVDGDEVLCLDTNSLKFTKGKAKVLKHPSPPHLFEIKTSSVSLITTAEHQLLVFQGNKIVKKRVSELREGDVLIFPKRIEIKGKKIRFKDVFVKRYYKITPKISQMIKAELVERKLSKTKVAAIVGTSGGYIDHIARNDRNFREDELQKILPFFSIEFPSEDFIPQNSIHGKFLILPKESSPELMQIIGYFLGDGYAGKRHIRFKDRDKEVLEIYQKLIEKVFNIKGKIKRIKGISAYLLEINSTFLSEWIKENVVLRKDEFLSEVGKLPLEELAAFLRGLFDAEGAVNTKARQIFLGTTSEKLAKTIQFLLFRFGILPSLSILERKEKNWRNAYIVSLSNSSSIRVFFNQIGFSSISKKKKVESLLQKIKFKEKGGFRSFKIFPFPKSEIYQKFLGIVKKSVLKKFLGSGKNLNCFITDWNLIKFIEFLRGNKEVSKNQEIEKIINDLEKFLNGDVVFQQITEKKKIKSPYSYLYDLQVDPYPNFIVNCILSHNCRWATHGSVSETNAHPHWDCKKEIFLVHNGIIENYKELKEKLINEGHKFTSETDTEVMVHLIEKYFKGNLEEAVRKMIREIRGAYAIAVISKRDPQKIVAARLSSPLLLGINKDEFLVASDPAAIITRTRQIINLDDNEIAVLKPNDFYILKEKPVEQIEWTLEEAEKGGYPHFMLKEIMEEPETIENAIRGRLIPEEGNVKLGGLDSVQEKLRKIKKLVLVACGTSFFAAKIGELMFEEYAGIESQAEIASEFRYRKPILDKNTAAIFISQSGETADTLAALREVKKKGILALGITNVVGSTQARETDAGVYTRSGPEIAVASTKAFLGQLAVLAMMTVFFGRQREMSFVIGKRIVSELKNLPNLAREVLRQAPEIEKLAKKYKDFKNFWFIGRKYNFPIALEGALKLKEISYLHAEGVAGGELKHGPLALIDENFPTIAICPSDSVYDKMLSNIEEVKARGGPVIAVATKGNEEIKKLVDDVIYIPKTLEMLTPMLSIIPLHLFAYYMAVLHGRDVDKPRNLAKSVTVE